MLVSWADDSWVVSAVCTSPRSVWAAVICDCVPPSAAASVAIALIAPVRLVVVFWSSVLKAAVPALRAGERPDRRQRAHQVAHVGPGRQVAGTPPETAETFALANSPVDTACPGPTCAVGKSGCCVPVRDFCPGVRSVRGSQVLDHQAAGRGRSGPHPVLA